MLFNYGVLVYDVLKQVSPKKIIYKIRSSPDSCSVYTILMSTTQFFSKKKKKVSFVK